MNQLYYDQDINVNYNPEAQVFVLEPDNMIFRNIPVTSSDIAYPNQLEVCNRRKQFFNTTIQENYHNKLEFFLDPIRHLVSSSKKRLVNEKYNLDLTYITDKIIALGVPSKSSLYRNPYNDVKKFFNTEIGKGNYKIYNLCTEPTYDSDVEFNFTKE